MKLPTLCLMVSTFMITACTHAQTSSAASSRVEYYFGDSSLSSPQGVPWGTTQSLVKRVIDPDSSRLTEIVAEIKQEKLEQEFTTEFAVNGDVFAIADREGTFEGRGKLEGKAWEWTSWDFAVRMKDGSGTLQGHDLKTADGLRVEKKFFAPDGTLRVLISEDLKRIDEARYGELRARFTKP